MSQFLRLLSENDKSAALLDMSRRLRIGKNDSRVFEVLPRSFYQVPCLPFAYWISENVRALFSKMPALEDGASGRVAKRGLIRMMTLDSSVAFGRYKKSECVGLIILKVVLLRSFMETHI